MIPVLVVFFTGLTGFSFTPLGRALAKRLGGGGGAGPGPELEASVHELQDQLDSVRRELSEVQERLDFTERALAQVKEQKRLTPG